jgi:hypothetical protein
VGIVARLILPVDNEKHARDGRKKLVLLLRDLNQEQLAEGPWSRTHISGVLAGDRRPSPKLRAFLVEKLTQQGWDFICGRSTFIELPIGDDQ